MHHAIPAGFEVRRARPDDADAVTALVAASQEALRGAFVVLHQRGTAKVILAVELDVAVEALDLYRRAGMEEVRRIGFFEKRRARAVDL